MKHLVRKSASKAAGISRRRLLFLVVVAVMVAITPIIVISRQKLVRAESRPEPGKTYSANNAQDNRTRLAGQEVQIETQSGEIKPLTAQEAEKLAEGLAPMLDDSADGLEKVHHADGSVSMDLQGRFQNVTVARFNSDGTIEQSCVDNARGAAKFFGINPALIEKAPTRRNRVRPN